MNRKLEQAEAWFESTARKVIQKRWWVIAVIIAVTAAALPGLPKVELDTSFESWFMEDSPLNRNKEEFEKHFDNSDYLAFLIEADDVFSPDIIGMLRELGDDLETEVPFAGEVVSLANIEYSQAVGEEIIIDDLVPDPAPTDPAEIKSIRRKALAKEAMRNRIVSEDSKETWLILEMKPYPEEWRGKYDDPPDIMVGSKVLEILARDEYRDYSIKATGMPIIGVEELHFTEAEAGKLTTISVLVAILLLIVFLRSVAGVVIPLLVTVVSVLIVFGFMGHLGVKVNAFLVTIPVFLALALSIGYSIHLFNYYHRQMTLSGRRLDSIAHSVKKAGWPIFFTVLTTMAALLSFTTIQLVPIQWLGITTAILLLVVYLLIMTVTPVLLSFGKDKEPDPVVKEKGIWTDHYFTGLGRWVFKYGTPIVVVFVMLTVVLAYGLTRTEVNIDTERSYGKKVHYINRVMSMARSQIGSFYSYDVTLTFPEPDAVKDPEVLHRFDAFVGEIQVQKLTKKVSSVLDIIKDMNRLFYEDKPEYYRIPETKEMVAQLLLLYEMSGGRRLKRWVDNSYRMIRLNVETKDLIGKEMLHEINFIQEKAGEMFPGAELNLTGSMAEFAAINQYVAIGQIKSFLVALAVIMVLMMIVFKSVKTGLIGMVPNLAPAFFVGGIMGLANIPLDFMTVTITPMILGLAVDDTIHFISHIDSAYRERGDYRAAVIDSLKVVGRALFLTTFILAAAFATYLFSIINMFIYLGIFIVVGISSALIADYLLAPVLIGWVKPFGKEERTGS